MTEKGRDMLLKLFIASCAIHLIVQGHFALSRFVETIPFNDSWAYYRNLHPVRHSLLVGLKWVSLATALILGMLLIAKKVRR